MRCLTRGLMLAAAICLLPAIAAAAEPTPATATVRVSPPQFPTPFIASIVGLSLTAVAVVGARVTQRSSGTMMYTVLACVTLTAVFVSAAHRIHTNFDTALLNQLAQLQRAAR